ncbi:hypothetical protein CIPAW_10G101100 [Carya illinoinensis]|uniref:Isopenicillin N synthase-like Fe(2+) 2OG dioxygenase domain-containing protein n=1 Tax=Carya illinoinensis TaxID=32201 RepID=A0A8T1PEC9_CARIL|nr:hypothetical protein CIPAW_10G101100 [Carya illinoinensis]
MGMPSHSDHCLLSLLIYNGISSLQVQHKGQWVNVILFPMHSWLTLVTTRR